MNPPSIPLPSLTVVIRKDHNGEPYEDPPIHMQDRLEKDRESAKDFPPQGTMFHYSTQRESFYFPIIRAYARVQGIICAIINDGETEPPDAELILIRKAPKPRP